MSRIVHASDLQKTRLHFRVRVSRVGQPLSEVQYTFEGINGENTVSDAFRFWTGYLNGKFTIDVSLAGRKLDPVVGQPSAVDERITLTLRNTKRRKLRAMT